MRKVLRTIYWDYCFFHRRKGSNTVRLGLTRYTFSSLGENVRFDYRSTFRNPSLISIGNDVFFARDCYFAASSAISVGNGCMFGPKVFCVAGSHFYEGEDLRSVPYDNRIIDSPVIIEDNVWIAGNVSIAPGSHIGKGSVIGLGCVVAGEIPPYSVVIGSKAQVVKQRDKGRYEELVASGAIFNKVYAGSQFETIPKRAN